MEIVFGILGGLLLLGILKAIGAIQEIFTLIILNLLSGGVAALASWIFNWNTGLAFTVGIWIGAGIYGLYCVLRIINPEISITYYSDGSSVESNERLNGIVGIIVLIIATIIALS